ncbi:MAG: hypothetical protein KAR40_13540 [Candidatus Sabulitectum sp.]|nr:hypothetical protein [Candidatus Sabulitectum sp.]
MRTSILERALLDLIHELKDDDIDLIIGGGYGILLRVNERKKSGTRTLLSAWPQERTTGDIDLFLRAELLINPEQLRPLRTALDSLDYKPVESAKFYQFYKDIPDLPSGTSLKLDILTGPVSRFVGTNVKTDNRRAKPRYPKVDLHAHPTNEAISLEEYLEPVKISGITSSSTQVSGVVFTPHAFTFLMMKLFAFRDRYTDKNKDYGIYHALDIYSILATTTEEEWESAFELKEQYRNDQYFVDACSIVQSFFSDKESIGIIRLKESPYYQENFEVDDFIINIINLFSA